MGRAEDIRAKYEAELALAEAEDRLIDAKAKGITGEKWRVIKDELRAQRQSFREQHAGDATASPATVAAKATVKKVG